MRRRISKTVLLHGDDCLMLGDSDIQIKLCRNSFATFAVWGGKAGSSHHSNRQLRIDWSKTEALKSPLAIKQAIENIAGSLNVSLQWDKVNRSIASIDWVTAAVVAVTVGLEMPGLPEVEDLLSQRSLRAFGRVRLGAEWGDEMHEVDLSFERWVRILCGEHWEVRKSYFYEGKRFTGAWSFDGGKRQLEVTYDDCGVGWHGDLGELDLIWGHQLDDVDLARLALTAA